MRRVLLAALLLAVPACGDDGGATPDAGFNCEIDQRDEEFVAGMEKTGEGGMTFRLVSSEPAPPARYDNAWVLEVEDATGAPLAGAFVEVKPFMPDHNHGTSVPAVITEDTTVPGRYAADPVNLFMPGIWEITIRATPAGGTLQDRDEAVFVFCISA